jgi:hypothetical protein
MQPQDVRYILIPWRKINTLKCRHYRYVHATRTPFATFPLQQTPPIQIHSSNPSGPTASNCGARPPHQILRSLSVSNPTLRLLVDAPWHVPNHRIRRDLHMPSVKEEIFRSSHRYYTRLTTHPNDQALALLAPPGTRHQAPGTRRLRRHMPNDLPGRFGL